MAPLLENFKREFRCKRAHVYEQRPYKSDRAGKFAVFSFSPTKVTTNKTLFRQLFFVLPGIDSELIEDIDAKLL